MRQQLLKTLVIISNKKPSPRQGFFLFILFLFSLFWFCILNLINYECPIHTLFHLYCPGCGGTRMILSLLHFDFYQAFRWNPLLFILLFIGLIYLIFMGIVYKKKKVFVLPSMKVWIILIIILILYMILRNLDTFIYLIPTEV